MRVVWALLIAFTYMLPVSYARSQSDERAMQLANNLSHEHILCSVYFGIVSDCAGKRDAALGVQYEKLRSASMERAINYSLIAKVLPKATISRTEMAVSEMKDSIQNNCSNISILAQKYAARCKMLIENPEEYAAKKFRP